MIKILRLFFKFETEYIGYPLYVSGNALRHALSLPLDTSIGIFMDKQPDTHPILTYDDFFKPRTKKQFLQPFFSSRYNRRSNEKIKYVYYLPSFITFDVINPPENIIEYIYNKELIQIGKYRNLASGIVHLYHYSFINLDKLELPSKGTHAILLSSSLSIPRFFERYNCRWDYEVLWNNGQSVGLNIIPPGQFFRVKSTSGFDLQKIAKRGIIKSSFLRRLGYGEFMIKDWSDGNGKISIDA